MQYSADLNWNLKCVFLKLGWFQRKKDQDKLCLEYQQNVCRHMWIYVDIIGLQILPQKRLIFALFEQSNFAKNGESFLE